MKLRDPGEKLGEITGKNVEELSKKLPQGREWHSFHVRLITPMFGGGVCKGEPDSDMPVRASAIRGQLRYWWRFLRKNHPEESCRLNGEELFSREGEIWGKMAAGGEDGSSKVFLRVSNISFDKENDIRPCAKYNRDARSGQYPSVPKFDSKVAPYAMLPGRGELTDDRKAIKKEPAHLLYSLSFDLHVSCEDGKDVYETEILPALRWWATFGGIGSRTRRGLGAVHVFASNHHSAQQNNNRNESQGHQTGTAPGIHMNEQSTLYVDTSEAKKYGCRLIVRSFNTKNPISCWHHCIDIMQQFRQLAPVIKGNRLVGWKGIGRKTRFKTIRDEQKEMPSSSNWPEPNAIRKITGKSLEHHQPPADAPICFPRALFGMPIEFAFISDQRTPPTTKILPKDNGEVYDRLASPLILKPAALSSGKYAAIAMLMPYDHCKSLGIKLRYVQNHPEEKQGEWEFSPYKWNCNGNAPPITSNNGNNALEAFMNFFAKGGRL